MKMPVELEQMINLATCERCRIGLANGDHKLIGSVYARLCPKCLREWAQYFRALPACMDLYQARMRVEFALAVSSRSHHSYFSEENFDERTAAHMNRENAASRIATEWMNAVDPVTACENLARVAKGRLFAQAVEKIAKKGKTQS